MDDARATVEAIADDDTMGAAETAERAAHVLVRLPANELPDAIETLLRGHPQMAPLWRLASDVLSSSDPQTGVEWFLSRLAGDANAVPVLAPILPDRILTISYSATVKEAIRMREPGTVLCMSSQPGGEGMQMVGALSAYTDASVIDDDEAIGEVPADAVVVGADAITPIALINKVKTREIAEAARARSIPCFAIAGEMKFVPVNLPSGEPFQLVSLDRFSGIATPMGLITPTEATTHASEVPLHDALRTLIERLEEEPDEDAEEPAS